MAIVPPGSNIHHFFKGRIFLVDVKVFSEKVPQNQSRTLSYPASTSENPFPILVDRKASYGKMPVQRLRCNSCGAINQDPICVRCPRHDYVVSHLKRILQYKAKYKAPTVSESPGREQQHLP